MGSALLVALTAALSLGLDPLLAILARDAEPSAGSAGGDRALLVGVLVAVAATDWLDGYLARRIHAVSSFGSTVDGVADKAVQFVPLFWFALVDSPAFPPVSLWLPSLLLVR